MFSVFFKCAFCEIMWENVLDSDRPQMAMWRVSFACLVYETTDTHSEYEILNAFPLQRCLHYASPGYVYSTLLLLFIVKMSVTS
jgi:hypothetical protein